MKTRICICTHNFPLRPNYTIDAGSFVLDFALELVKLDKQVSVFTPDMDGVKADYPGLNVKWFNWLGGNEKLGQFSFFNPVDCVKLLSLLRNGCKELTAFARQNKFDTSLAMWAFPSGFFAYNLKKKLGIPYSVWALGRDIWLYAKYPVLRDIIKTVLRNADFLFADGIKLSNDVEAISGRKCIFLPTARILPVNNKFEVDINKRKVNFLFIGRYEKVKGVDILLEAMNLLAKEGPEVNLYLFGIGSLEEYMKERIKRQQLQKNVFLGGYASPSIAAAYMGKCDCLIIPSRMESIPIIFSDALQMKIPMIVTDVGDMGKLARDWDVAKVIPPADPVELMKAMRDFMKTPDKRLEENQEKLAQEFNLTNIARIYMEYIEG